MPIQLEKSDIFYYTSLSDHGKISMLLLISFNLLVLRELSDCWWEAQFYTPHNFKKAPLFGFTDRPRHVLHGVKYFLMCLAILNINLNGTEALGTGLLFIFIVADLVSFFIQCINLNTVYATLPQ